MNKFEIEIKPYVRFSVSIKRDGEYITNCGSLDSSDDAVVHKLVREAFEKAVFEQRQQLFEEFPLK